MTSLISILHGRRSRIRGIISEGGGIFRAHLTCYYQYHPRSTAHPAAASDLPRNAVALNRQVAGSEL